MTGCTFFRTDANAVFLAAYNRNATVVDNEFAFIGMSAVVTFGATQQDDGTVGTQPWGTVIAYNLVRELGTYQLQSSAWFTSRAALTRAEGNVVFNIPRAAINFNDAFGGGNNVSHVSIFNTCRQSGDHGPMNSCVRVALRLSSRSSARAPPPLTPPSCDRTPARPGGTACRLRPRSGRSVRLRPTARPTPKRTIR